MNVSKNKSGFISAISIILIAIAIVFFTTCFSGCSQDPPDDGSVKIGGDARTDGDAAGGADGNTRPQADAAVKKARIGTGVEADVFSFNNEIRVVSRREGSGTKDAFFGLIKVLLGYGMGGASDISDAGSVICGKNEDVIAEVEKDPYAIGYVSFGMITNTVKTLETGGIAASDMTIRDGSYKLQRPFTIFTKGGASELAGDFIAFISSADGAKVITENHYAEAGVQSAMAESYTGGSASGNLVVAGSSSVAFLMEKLRDAYMKLNTGASVEIQISDSASGLSAVESGYCDIGMSSRELTDSEKSGLSWTIIAYDGIAVIVSKDNPYLDIPLNGVGDIFSGKTEKWGDID